MPLVYLIDERINNPRAALGTVPKVDLGFLINPYASITEIVSMVIDGLGSATPAARGRSASKAADTRMITALRILAHGDSAELHLGRGIDARNAVQLAPLAECIRAGASAHCLLLGCNVASTTHRVEDFLGGAAIGQRFGYHGGEFATEELSPRATTEFPLLAAISRTLGVPVTAPLESQSAARDWHLLGATVTVDSLGEATFAGGER